MVQVLSAQLPNSERERESTGANQTYQSQVRLFYHPKLFFLVQNPNYRTINVDIVGEASLRGCLKTPLHRLFQ